MSKCHMVRSSDKKLVAKTDFHVHISQMSAFDGYRHKIFDFTEKRLLLLIEKAITNSRKNDILHILAEFKAGRIAIAWSEGQLVFVRIKKEKV